MQVYSTHLTAFNELKEKIYRKNVENIQTKEQLETAFKRTRDAVSVVLKSFIQKYDTFQYKTMRDTKRASAFERSVKRWEISSMNLKTNLLMHMRRREREEDEEDEGDEGEDEVEEPDDDEEAQAPEGNDDEVADINTILAEFNISQ